MRSKGYKKNPRSFAAAEVECHTVAEARRAAAAPLRFTVKGRTVARRERQAGVRRSISREEIVRYLRAAPKIDAKQFRKDVEAFVDQSIE